MATAAAHSKKKTSAKKWSGQVTKRSNALDLRSQIFNSTDSGTVARSLKRSAERSKRRKGTPFQSAMSMLNFYVNRAGKNLPASRKKILERAKTKLRELFKRPAASGRKVSKT